MPARVIWVYAVVAWSFAMVSYGDQRPAVNTVTGSTVSTILPAKIKYNNSHRRSPFSVPTRAQAAANQQGAIAGNFAAESLRLLGTFMHSKGGKKWAFIVAPDGKVHKVIKGSVVGSHSAVVTDIAPKAVTLTEGNGQKKKIITLNLDEPS